MLRLLTTHSCIWCEPNKTLARAALASEELYKTQLVVTNTPETEKAAMLGLGLPVLVREDGAMSKDAKTWLGAPKRKEKQDGGKDITGVSKGVSAKHQSIADQSGGHDDSGDEEPSAVC